MATIPLAKYLWARIREIGVQSIFGVPGDYNLHMLDSIFEIEDLNWVGNANELGAAYAADGYARVKGVPGVVVTTYGVGELSALNAIAGSFAEQVKVIHIVGQPSRQQQDTRQVIHHCNDIDPDHGVYMRMSEPVRAATAYLQDVATAPAEIDCAIRECFLQSRPVYIFFPSDLVNSQVQLDLLQQKIDLSLPVDRAGQDLAVSAILKTFSAARSPALLLDALVSRHDAVEEVRQLVDSLQIPVYYAMMGKHIIDDTHKCMVGLYNGLVSSRDVWEAFQTSDLVLVLGSVPADTNTGGFTRQISQVQIEIRPFEVIVDGKSYPGTFMKPLLGELAQVLAQTRQPIALPKLPSVPAPKVLPDHPITHSWVWGRLVHFFRPGDVVLGDTGTCTFGLHGENFPPGSRFVTQTFYGSIGWATPATLGSELAIRDGSKMDSLGQQRTILVTGDGSFGLTMQEVGTMIRKKLAPILFIINNDGYTIERVIHGARQPYNDISKLDYAQLFPFFSHPSPETSYHRCTTAAELEETLQKLPRKRPEHPILVEIIMDKLDVPWRLSSRMAMRGPQAVQTLREEGFSGWKNGQTPNEWSMAKHILNGA